MRGLAAAVLAACSGVSHAGPAVAPTAAPTVTATAPATAAATVPATVIDQLAVAGEVALVTAGGTAYAFDPQRVTVLRGGQVIARASAPGPPWTAAVGLAGPDGDRWAVGLAGGALWRVTGAGELEPVGARLGIGDARVLAIDAVGPGFAIGLAGGVAVSRDGVHLERFSGGDATAVAIARTRVAVARAGAVEVYDLGRDLGRGTRVVYPVERPRAVAFADPLVDDARLVALAGGAAYAEDRGALRRIPAPGAVRELAVSGPRIWLVASGRLFSLDPRGLVERISALPPAAHVHRASGGDVWVSQAGQSIRYSPDAPIRATDWPTAIGPVFRRACAKCHLPDGPADLDLSTPTQWAAHAAALRHVVDTRVMPPAGAPISDADRAALQRWLARGTGTH